ncbi:MAG: hypothetical protein IJ449_00305 [Clostridia bacterium]|nr:hypothetical protein [Clostridia bacterium]
MKRLIPKLLLCGLLALLLTGCSLFSSSPRSLNRIISEDQSFTGTVEQKNDITIFVRIADAEDSKIEGQIASVPTNAIECPDSMTDFSVGDEVTVYFNGAMSMSDPIHITNVSAVCLTTPVDRTKNNVG